MSTALAALAVRLPAVQCPVQDWDQCPLDMTPAGCLLRWPTLPCFPCPLRPALPRRFEQHCWSAWEPRRNAWRDCFSDEHYFPTLMAVLGKEGETECQGWGVAAQDWSKEGAHPRAFK